MYRRPKFLEVLHAIREEMSREVDYDVDLFAEMVRSGVRPSHGPEGAFVATRAGRRAMWKWMQARKNMRRASV